MPITTDVLLDTNILLRTHFDKQIQLTNATRAVVELRRAGVRLATTVQNIAEFVNTCTRPEADNGYEISLTEAFRRVEYFEASFDILSESSASFAEWKSLVMHQQVLGKQVHDARIAAVMLSHGIRNILTFNTRHFLRFSQLQVWHPDQVLGIG